MSVINFTSSLPSSSMEHAPHTHLSRRETQIMDLVYQSGEASVADVKGRMPDEVSYDTVRITLGVLEKKGYLTHYEEGRRYIYTPVVPPEMAKRSALGHLLKTFFAGSSSQAILTLLDMSAARLSKEDLDEIEGWIEEAKKKP